jgi:hypothetical protein
MPIAKLMIRCLFVPVCYIQLSLLLQTISISMLLRYSQHQIFVFIVELLQVEEISIIVACSPSIPYQFDS